MENPSARPSEDVTFSPISHQAYFSQYHQRVSNLLRDFSSLRRDALRSANVPVRTRLQELACELLQSAIEVAGSQSQIHGPPSLEYYADLVSRLRRLLDMSPNEAIRAGSHELQKHFDYFEENVPKTNREMALQEEGAPAAVTIDFLTNATNVAAKYVFNEYPWQSTDPRATAISDFFQVTAARDSVTSESRRLMELATQDLEGWCSEEKALLLYSMVREYRPHTVVEIGIYGGRSIIPIAAGLRDNAEGEVYGIETWSGAEATSYRTSIGNDFWWMNIDFARLKGAFLDFLVRHQLHQQVRIVEARSDRCAPLFERIDLLHIDGGHSTFGAAQDVINFVPKVRSGGLIIYDDINWSTTGAGLEILLDSCRLLHVVPAFDNPTVPGCAAFQKV